MRTARLVLGMLLGVWACRLGNFNTQPVRLDGLARLGGSVTVREPTGAPLVVAVLRYPGRSGHRVELAETTYVDSSGAYEFALPAGSYQLVAFEDGNSNQRVDDGEQGASLGPIAVREQTEVLPVHLEIRGPLQHSLPQAEDRRLVVVGEVAKLTDDRFGPSAGELGIWQPVEMMATHQPGLYLLEEYQPMKIPVVFVHGLGGYAQEFRTLVARLDREHFQPWVLTYASGLRLESLAQFFHDALEEMHHAYPYRRLCLVAHSMGALIARRTVSFHLAQHEPPLIRAVVSIAAPMGGIQSAALGVELSPIVVPAWKDLAPDSDFLKHLYREPLPHSVEYTLLATMQREGADDGEVTIQSQLFDEAQAEASLVRAFIATHTGALAKPKIIRHVNAALERCRTASSVSPPASKTRASAAPATGSPDRSRPPTATH